MSHAANLVMHLLLQLRTFSNFTHITAASDPMRLKLAPTLLHGRAPQFRKQLPPRCVAAVQTNSNWRHPGSANEQKADGSPTWRLSVTGWLPRATETAHCTPGSAISSPSGSSWAAQGQRSDVRSPHERRGRTAAVEK